MEHFITIAFWIATLSVCLLAKSISLPIDESNIDEMRKNVACLPDSVFYTPLNVEDQCITAALSCFEKELGMVIEECNGSRDIIYQAKEFLIEMIRRQLEKEKGNVPKNSTECACENWAQTPFATFLNKAESLIQQVNTGLASS